MYPVSRPRPRVPAPVSPALRPRVPVPLPLCPCRHVPGPVPLSPRPRVPVPPAPRPRVPLLTSLCLQDPVSPYPRVHVPVSPRLRPGLPVLREVGSCPLGARGLGRGGAGQRRGRAASTLDGSPFTAPAPAPAPAPLSAGTGPQLPAGAPAALHPGVTRKECPGPSRTVLPHVLADLGAGPGPQHTCSALLDLQAAATEISGAFPTRPGTDPGKTSGWDVLPSRGSSFLPEAVPGGSCCHDAQRARSPFAACAPGSSENPAWLQAAAPDAVSLLLFQKRPPGT
ncbi:translation initiation factor IF-2-like [Myotis myotis]|uniref:translation initiation factor IF-2-like n=1 Tax=Myotis myotis TaxID=51298 RepID=UPI00174C6C0D|nr:translation initiation factor IF-2-like [Myotis myotis]